MLAARGAPAAAANRASCVKDEGTPGPSQTQRSRHPHRSTTSTTDTRRTHPQVPQHKVVVAAARGHNVAVRDEARSQGARVGDHLKAAQGKERDGGVGVVRTRDGVSQPATRATHAGERMGGEGRGNVRPVIPPRSLGAPFGPAALPDRKSLSDSVAQTQNGSVIARHLVQRAHYGAGIVLRWRWSVWDGGAPRGGGGGSKQLLPPQPHRTAGRRRTCAAARAARRTRTCLV